MFDNFWSYLVFFLAFVIILIFVDLTLYYFYVLWYFIFLNQGCAGLICNDSCGFTHAEQIWNFMKHIRQNRSRHYLKISMGDPRGHNFLEFWRYRKVFLRGSILFTLLGMGGQGWKWLRGGTTAPPESEGGGAEAGRSQPVDPSGVGGYDKTRLVPFTTRCTPARPGTLQCPATKYL